MSCGCRSRLMINLKRANENAKKLADYEKVNYFIYKTAKGSFDFLQSTEENKKGKAIIQMVYWN